MVGGGRSWIAQTRLCFWVRIQLWPVLGLDWQGPPALLVLGEMARFGGLSVCRAAKTEADEVRLE